MEDVNRKVGGRKETRKQVALGANGRYTFYCVVTDK